jgi:CRP/FNR family transcriptional regulator/CRP/FNR family cyclic AMP-dependent transcriptional regulator
VQVFASLTEEELSALGAGLRRRAFGRGVIIYHKDSPGEILYIIESGTVRTFCLSDWGREMSLDLYGPGEVFGELSLLDGLPRSTGAIALERTITYTLTRSDLLRCLERYPRIAIGIIEMLAARLRYATDYAEHLAFLDVHGRVAARLLDLAERYGVQKEGVEIQLRLTQSALGSWVGATREHVNRVLAHFRDRGLISVEGFTITVNDPAALHDLVVQ